MSQEEEYAATYARCAALAIRAERLGRIDDARNERLAADDAEAMAIAEIGRAIRRLGDGNFRMVPQRRKGRSGSMPVRVRTMISGKRVHRLVKEGHLVWVNMARTCAVPARRVR